MKPINEKTVKLLSRSGLVLLFLSMAGSFAMATITVSENVNQHPLDEMFGLLFLAAMGIAVYYLALSGFGWIIIRRRKG